MSVPDWFPDWTGQTAVIAACGRSLCREDIQDCIDAGVNIVAVNDAWTIVPEAAVLYACDWRWWGWKGPHPADFRQLRIRGSSPSGSEAGELPAARLVTVYATKKVTPAPAKVDPLQWTGDRITNGGNSGLQAANLVARWGVSKIILLGVDCDEPNAHFNGGIHQFKSAARQSKATVKAWRERWEATAPQFKAAGVEVVNASFRSKLSGQCFEKVPLSKAL